MGFVLPKRPSPWVTKLNFVQSEMSSPVARIRCGGEGSQKAGPRAGLQQAAAVG